MTYQVGDGNTSETIQIGRTAQTVQIGGSAATLVAFHGATPVAQGTTIASLTASTTLTQAVVLLNSVIQVLKDKGLIA